MTCRLLPISELGHAFPHRIAVSPNPGRREVWLRKQVRMARVELAANDHPGRLKYGPSDGLARLSGGKNSPINRARMFQLLRYISRLCA